MDEDDEHVVDVVPIGERNGCQLLEPKPIGYGQVSLPFVSKQRVTCVHAVLPAPMRDCHLKAQSQLRAAQVFGDLYRVETEVVGLVEEVHDVAVLLTRMRGRKGCYLWEVARSIGGILCGKEGFMRDLRSAPRQACT